MSSHNLEEISWYKDSAAEAKGEPGIYHSFMKSLATVIFYIEGEVDPVWLMGCSGFAFRIWVNEVMCPSAMSVFNFSTVLTAAIEQAGYQAIYISRYWDESDLDSKRRAEAHGAILEGIDRGVPAIVWDVADAEWGLITGYDLNKNIYQTLTHIGKSHSMPFEKLGRNGIDILSVTIPGAKNKINRDEIIKNALNTAVSHAGQKEWTDRPKYQNGLLAYDLWASLFEKWAMIVRAGKEKNISSEIWNFARYYAGHYYSARCYAREFLKSIANKNEALSQAAACYEKVASLLMVLWEFFYQENNIDADIIYTFSENIKSARTLEEKGINFIKDYLSEPV